MKIVTFGSIKGGVGKTSMAAMTANCLAAAGFKVLVIDMDWNNSLSFYYLDKEGAEMAREKNIAAALFDAGGNIQNYIVPTRKENIKMIPSSLGLLDLQAISDRRLKIELSSLPDDLFDVVIIDTAPTYDNIVRNAYGASDFIITPIELTQFDYNTAVCLSKKLKTETDKFNNWFLLFNGINLKGSKKQNEYVEMFRGGFSNFTPEETWMPKRESVKDVLDRDLKIRKTNPLFSAVVNLAECFIDDDAKFENLEAF